MRHGPSSAKTIRAWGLGHRLLMDKTVHDAKWGSEIRGTDSGDPNHEDYRSSRSKLGSLFRETTKYAMVPQVLWSKVRIFQGHAGYLRW